MKYLKEFETVAALNTAVQSTPVDLIGLAYDNGDAVVRMGVAIQPNDEIWYTTIDRNIIEVYSSYDENISVVSNVYKDGKGVIKFSGPVTNIPEYYFQIGEKLATISLPSSVTVINEEAFYGCSNLINANIPDSVTRIDSYAFRFVRNINYSGSATGSPWGARCVNGYVEDGLVYTDNTKTELAGASSGITGEVTIPNTVTSIHSAAFSGCHELTSVIIPSSVTRIENYTFEGCENMTHIVIPDSVVSIGEYAFYNCIWLESVTMSNNVTSIGMSCFSICDNLASITIPDGVNSIGSSAFSSVINVNYSGSATGSPWGARYVNGYAEEGIVYTDSTKTELVGARKFIAGIISIPNTVTTIRVGAFRDHKFITSVNIPNSVTSVGSGAFSSVLNINYSGSATGSPWGARHTNGYVEDDLVYTDSTKTELVGGPVGISGNIILPDTVTTIDNDAFSYCDKMTSIIMPDTVTTIGTSAFLGCDGLTSVNIPANVTTIPRWAFNSCHNLMSITIPNGVTTIGNAAFSACNNLRSVTLGNSVTTIGDHAFSQCFKLNSITSLNTIPPETYDEEVFYRVPETCLIYVPAESVETYKSSIFWSDRADYIQAIPNN